jgi:hypothetical protein
MMEVFPQAEKFAWSLAEISDCTGLSVAYLRNEVRRGALPIKKFGRRILVLKKDLNAYLDSGSPSKTIEHTQA